MKNVFEELRAGVPYHIQDKDYQEQAHGEMDRSRHLCWKIAQTDPLEKETIMALEEELFGEMKPGTFLTPPFQVDIACRLFMGENVFANHGLTVMSVGTITIDDGVMMGPEVGLFTVNHDPDNIRIIQTKEIHICKNAWLGSRVNVMPGVTIGEGAIVASGAVVTKDVPPRTVVAGVPAKVVKTLER